MTTNNAESSPSKREQQRKAVHQWAQQHTHPGPCEAVFFRWKRLKLNEFTGREELATRPLWYIVGSVALFLLLSPFLIVFGWIREWLELFGVVRESEVKTDTKPAPGVILVSGSTDNPVLTELIDTVKRTQRPLWLVVSRTRVTVLVMNNPAKPPRVVWQTDDTATIRFHHAALHSIEITWPDGSRAYLCPTIEERKIITSFVNATWNNEPR